MSGKDFLFHSHYVFFGARFHPLGGVWLCAWNPFSVERRAGVGEVTDTERWMMVQKVSY